MDGEAGASRVEALLRELAPRVLGAVARRYDDFHAAEDAVQEALIAAGRQWPGEGVPGNPAGWLYQVALRRLTDHARSETARRRREEAAAEETRHRATFLPAHLGELGTDPDDALALLFMCCHPALTAPSAIALTLRAVGGLSTGEIASAFMVREATMGQRISRAKATLAQSGVSLAMPEGEERAGRLSAVMHTLYLIFNEGYTSSHGPRLCRVILSREAIRLTRLLHELISDEPEVEGLLALMLLTDARRVARMGDDGLLVPLDRQDRSLWDRDAIDEGVRRVSRALKRGRVGPYQLQAAIAAVHSEAASMEETDWPQILALYGVLMRMGDNPMVALNHAVATAMVHGAVRGLELLGPLGDDPRLQGHHRLEAVRAHLLEMDGQPEAAAAAFRRAAGLTRNVPERDYLLLKAGRM